MNMPWILLASETAPARDAARQSTQFSDTLLAFVVAFWTALTQMAPWLLFGFVFAGFLYVVISPRFIERHLGGQGVWPVVKATLFGIPLPLCSCGVIPVAASLRRSGASRGATTSFLMSTPQTGVDSIAVTYSLMGPVFTLFRVVAALVNGIVGGVIANLFGEKKQGRVPAQSDEPGHADHVACTDTAFEADSHGASCCSGGSCSACGDSDKQGNVIVRMLKYGLLTLPEDIGKSLLFGLLLAGLIAVFVPPDLFAGVFGDNFTGRLGMMGVMLLIGIPLYVCATSSVPVAVALVLKGVSPGAALVFLMTGPASNAASIATIWRVLGRRTTIIYLVTLAVSALVAGYMMDTMFPDISVPLAVVQKHAMLTWARHAAAVALLIVLAVALINPYLARRRARRVLHVPGDGSNESISTEKESVDMKTAFSVKGMTCSHCAMSVQRALNAFAGVESVSVDLHGASVEVVGDGFDVDAMRAAVEELGYTCEPATMS